MSNLPHDSDHALLIEFIEESEESLAKLPALFIELEKKSNDKEIISAIFRPVHSLKGNAAYFGLMNTKTLAHELETILDSIRKGTLVVTPSIISVLLEGIDVLFFMLGRVRKGDFEIDDAGRFESLINRVKKSIGLPKELCGSHYDELNELLSEMLKNKSEYAEKLQCIIYKIAPEKTIIIEKKAPEPYIALLSLLELPFDKTLYESKCSDIDIQIKLLQNCFEKGSQGYEVAKRLYDDFSIMMATVGFDSLLYEILVDCLAKLDEIYNWNSLKNQSTNVEKKPAVIQSEIVGKSMRVSEERIDEFLSYVGELITVREMFEYLHKRITAESSLHRTIVSEFKHIYGNFEALSMSLQNSIMAIRKVPISTILQKLPRLLRDTAVSLNKEVDVQVTGESIDIDKSIAESLEAPLIHLVRNAIDHGIEHKDERLKAGKSAQGKVRIDVEDTQENIVVIISDDGAGLNLNAIKSKAVSLGIIAEDAQLSVEKTADLLFISGLSTASKVSDISGRGVGMDVVKQEVSKLGGKVQVSTVQGKGTTFYLKIPKAVGTQIIEGMVVKIEQEFYIIPVEAVVETFGINSVCVTDIAGKGKGIMRRDKVFPLFSLLSVVENSGYNHALSGQIAISIKNGKSMCVLVVNEIVGIQQVVLKQVEGLGKVSEFCRGASVIGNGVVALVLDLEKILCQTSMENVSA